MALDAANVAIPADAKWSRNTIIEAMLGFQNENRWIRTDRKRQHQCRYDGHALQALAPYQERTEVKEAIDRAVSCLKEESVMISDMELPNLRLRYFWHFPALALIRLLQKWDLVHQTLI